MRELNTAELLNEKLGPGRGGGGGGEGIASRLMGAG